MNGAKIAPPYELVISRICEDFGCLPRQAMKALRRDPEVIAKILEARAYVAAHEHFKHAKDDDALGHSPMMDLVWEITADLMRERKQQRDDA